VWDRQYAGMESGNHFRDPGLRTAKAFAWVMKNS
jgi:hypothetical protein